MLGQEGHGEVKGKCSLLRELTKEGNLAKVGKVLQSGQVPRIFCKWNNWSGLGVWKAGGSAGKGGGEDGAQRQARWTEPRRMLLSGVPCPTAHLRRQPRSGKLKPPVVPMATVGEKPQSTWAIKRRGGRSILGGAAGLIHVLWAPGVQSLSTPSPRQLTVANRWPGEKGRPTLLLPPKAPLPRSQVRRVVQVLAAAVNPNITLGPGLCPLTFSSPGHYLWEERGGNSHDCLSCCPHSHNLSPDIRLPPGALGWRGLCVCPARNSGPGSRVGGLAGWSSLPPGQTERLSQTGLPYTPSPTAHLPLGLPALMGAHAQTTATPSAGHTVPSGAGPAHSLVNSHLLWAFLLT